VGPNHKFWRANVRAVRLGWAADAPRGPGGRRLAANSRRNHHAGTGGRPTATARSADGAGADAIHASVLGPMGDLVLGQWLDRYEIAELLSVAWLRSPGSHGGDRPPRPQAENVVPFPPDGRVKLLDSDIAQLEAARRMSWSSVSGALATPGHMEPRSAGSSVASPPISPGGASAPASASRDRASRAVGLGGASRTLRDPIHPSRGARTTHPVPAPECAWPRHEFRFAVEEPMRLCRPGKPRSLPNGIPRSVQPCQGYLEYPRERWPPPQGTARPSPT